MVRRQLQRHFFSFPLGPIRSEVGSSRARLSAKDLRFSGAPTLSESERAAPGNLLRSAQSNVKENSRAVTDTLRIETSPKKCASTFSITTRFRPKASKLFLCQKLSAT